MSDRKWERACSCCKVDGIPVEQHADFCMYRRIVADLAEARAQERRHLADGLRKFAPDLAEQIVKRWTEAHGAFDELLALLRR